MIFLDGTVLPELLLPDRRCSDEILLLVLKLEEPAAISALSLPYLYKVCAASGISVQTLQAIVERFHLVSSLSEDYEWASSLLTSGDSNQIDLSGVLQIAAAVRSGCRTFVTVDESRSALAAEHLPSSKLLHGLIDG
jgi:hypothetical protein